MTELERPFDPYEDSEVGIGYIISEINQFGEVAEKIHEGPDVDLCRILLKIIDDYRTYGIDHAVDRYWENDDE